MNVDHRRVEPVLWRLLVYSFICRVAWSPAGCFSLIPKRRGSYRMSSLSCRSLEADLIPSGSMNR